MEPIIGLGLTPQDKWSGNNSNVFMIDGMTSDEYVAAQMAAREPGSTKGVQDFRKEFWGERDKAVQETAMTIKQVQTQENPSVRRLESYSFLRNTDTANAEALLQVQGASEQWKKLDRVFSGMGGTVLGYDIETFGDTTGRNGIFGITEIGIGKTDVGQNGVLKQSGFSLVIGLDKTEAEYARGLLNQFKEQGWDSLQQHEQVTLQRMSMYGGDASARNFKSVFSKQIIDELGGGEFYVVNNLVKADMLPEQIERGIKFLSDVYEDGATREKVFRPALEYLYNSHEPNTSSKGWVITGANTKFDTGTMARYAEMYGIDTTGISTKGKSSDIIEMLKRDTVDLIYGTRTAAAVRNISVAEYQNRFHGKRGGGASVQSLLYSTGLNETETHMAISDINQQIKLLAAKSHHADPVDVSKDISLTHDVVQHLSGGTKKGYLQYDGSDVGVLKRYDAKNSVFLLNRGWLDKTSGKDIALISVPVLNEKGEITGSEFEATQNYTISGEYWELDTEHTGYADDKYILSLKSTADGTIVAKQFDTVDDMGAFLRANADWFERNEIINHQGVHQEIHAEQQAAIKYQDRGRREFERAIDPASVSTENGRIVGGFADMEQMLAWDAQYRGNFSGTPEGFRDFVTEAKKKGVFDVNKANSMQAYLGMQDKIAQESALLNSIVKQINESMPKADNMTKTIALRKAYLSAIDTMKGGAKLKSTAKQRNLIANDIFGVDVGYSVFDKDSTRISRINTHSVDAATRDVNRIFSGLTKEQAISVIQDFGERRIFTPEQTEAFEKAIKTVGIDAGGDVQKARRIGEYLKTESSYQLYTDIAYALHDATKIDTTGNVLVKGKKVRGKNAPQFTLESLSENLYAYSNLTFRGNHNVNSMYGISSVQTAVNKAVAQSISSTPTVTYYDSDYSGLRKQLQDLGARLNYGDDITFRKIDKNGEEHVETFLEQMFYGGSYSADGTFTPKGYNISQYKDKGLHTLIVQPDKNSSAYMLFTNDRNYGRLMDTLANTPLDGISSFKDMKKSAIAQYAGIYELPNIQRYTIEENISDAMKGLIGRDTIDLTVLKQSENSEKFLVNALNVYEQNGKVNAYVNNGVYDYLTAWRMGGEKGLKQVLDGDFEGFTSGMRRHQSKKVQELSGTSSYRGYMTESGKVVRMTNYGPGDYLYAYQMRMSDGLHSLFTHALSNNGMDKANDLDRMVDAFAEEFGEYHNAKHESLRSFRQRVAKQSYFEEFFNKNLFLGNVNEDSVIQQAYNTRYQNSSIFDLLYSTVKGDTSGLFNDNVQEALQKIHNVYSQKETINQVLSSTAMEKGLVSLGIKPGEYDVNAFLYSTMRPTYLQQNLGRSFNPTQEWNMDLEGNALHVDTMGKVSLKDGSQLRILKTITGSPEITVKEYLGQQALEVLKPGHSQQVRHVMTAFKQMNDYDLQMKYRYMSEQATTIANNLGMSVDQYRAYLSYMREDMLSVNEGKWFMDPLLGEQRFIRTNDAKKVFGFHIEDMDDATKAKTEAQLQSLKGKIITQNDVIGYSNSGKRIYYSGPETILTDANIEELMKDGETRVIPKVADIIDAKVMFNGSEKATAHAISVDGFMKYADAHGIAHGSRHETTMALSRIFNVLSDEAGFIGTQELEKHTNLSGLDSLWRTITTSYVHEGKGQILVNYLNNQVANSSEFAGVNPFEFKNGVIISNSSNATNPVSFINKVWNDVQMNTFGNAALNERIVDQVNWMRSKNILYGSMQFQNQNEHVSDGIAIDKRMEQGIRERILSIKNGGERWDLQWADELREYSQQSSFKGSNKGEGYRNVQKVFDYFNGQMNIGRAANVQKRRNMERGLHGIIESLVYYNAPDKFDVKSSNIVSLDFQDLMKTGIVPKNGVSVNTLHSSLFFEDGKPSEMLNRLAKSQGKHFGDQAHPSSYSLFIDLGKYSIKSADGKGVMNGFLIPIQTAITGADTTMFQTQQKIIASSLSKIENIIKNPGKRSSEQISQALSDVVGTMYNDLLKQLAAQNKDSDLYKTLQRQFMPNSGGLLAEQEVGPLLTELTDDIDFVNAVNRRNELEAEIAGRKHGSQVSESTIKELNEQYTIIKDKSEALANRIRGVRDENGNWIKRPEVFNFTALKGTGLEGIEKEIMADGTAKYSFVAATSRKALEEQGLNFGKFGMDIMFDYESNAGKNIPTIRTDSGIKQLYSASELATIRKKIMDSINADSSLGIKITSADTMVNEINDWMGTRYNVRTKNKRLEIDTETINRDMVNNGPLTRLFKHFDSVGEDYMRNIGVVGELVRYPTFRSQLASRMILSDHVQGNQVVMFNPITSSLTNVDFDGDLMYSIFKFDNGVPFLLNSKTYDISRNVYESGLDHIPDLLADLVADGEAFKSNHINNYVSQMAAMIEKFDGDTYKDVVKEYAKAMNWDEVAKGSAEEFVIRTSSEMQNAFFNMQMNTLTDLKVQKASIAPILRKANIGRISTPNFTVRNMVIGMQSRYLKLGDTVKADAATDILNALTNMKSKKGGLFDHAEQGAIDTKHVWDAMTTSQVARYSTGINLLFGRHAKNTADMQERAVNHIVSALYNNMFTKTQEVYTNRAEGIQSIVKEVMSHKGDMKYFLENKVADAHLKHGLVALLQMQELDADHNMENVKRLFNSELNQGRTLSREGVYMDKGVFELIEAFSKGEFSGQLNNTFLDNMEEFIQKSVSDRSLQISSEKGYVKMGSFKGDYEDYVYSLKESGYSSKSGAYATFDVLKYNRKKGTFEVHSKATRTYRAADNAKLNEMLQHEFHFNIDHNVSAIRNLTNDAMLSSRVLDRKKQERIFSDTVLHKKNFASQSKIMENIKTLDSMESWHIDKLGRQQYENIRAMFGQTAVDTQKIVQRASELSRVYEYAQAKGIAGTKQVQPNALIQSINEDIAAHPEKYGTQKDGVYNLTKTFDKILEEKFIADGVFDSVERIESVRKEMIAMDGFDSQTYNSALENMRTNLYDVRSEVNTLNARYSQLSKDFKGSDIVEKAMEGRETAVAKFTDALTQQNRTHINAAEKQIYGLFKNRTQMEMFFGLDKTIASGNTMVGFGEYMGYKFSDLSRGDIYRILSSASEYSSASPEAARAVERTTALLSEWSTTIGVPKNVSTMEYKNTPSVLLESALKEVENIQEHAKIEIDNIAKEAKDAAEGTLNDSVTEDVKEAASKASENAKSKTQKKTITGELWAKGKKALDDWGIKGKHVGIAVAGMAALGVANNLLHNQKNGSPLSPARKPNGNGSPSIDGNYPQHPHASGAGNAPRSVGNKVVYHDQQSGLNFKVSAKTMQNINPRQQGVNVGTMTGGSANVNVYQDNSGVTDNWLANKFAELS